MSYNPKQGTRMKTYVIPEGRGRFDLVERLLDEIINSSLNAGEPPSLTAQLRYLQRTTKDVRKICAEIQEDNILKFHQ